jgi:hypothetical protein
LANSPVELALSHLGDFYALPVFAALASELFLLLSSLRIDLIDLTLEGSCSRH